MEGATLFSQMPTTPEHIITQIRRQLGADARFGVSISTSELDRVADLAVRGLWGSRVKTYVPVFAFRSAREMLQRNGVVAAEYDEA